MDAGAEVWTETDGTTTLVFVPHSGKTDRDYTGHPPAASQVKYTAYAVLDERREGPNGGTRFLPSRQTPYSVNRPT